MKANLNAVITGGASGLGASTAEIVIENGGKATILDIQEDIGTENLITVVIQYQNDYDYYGEWCYDVSYKEYFEIPCFSWNQNSYSEWQSEWPDPTFSGLFENMTLNKFLDLTGLSSDNGEWWEQSSCED